MTELIGLGNTVVDYTIKVDDSFLDEYGLKKGTFSHLPEKFDISGLEYEISAGGGAANTICNFSALNGNAAFIGVIGKDKDGKLFKKSLKEAKVKSCLIEKEGKNAHLFALITPDGERTFAADLGNCSELYCSELPFKEIKNSFIFHTTGYKLDKEPMASAAKFSMKYAKDNGKYVSFDLASAKLINKYRKTYERILENYVDIVFANEDEAKEIGLKLEDIVKVAVYKFGAKGSLIRTRKRSYEIKTYPANFVNSNGAGDAYAAGFLYGIAKNYDFLKAGNLASMVAAKIVSKIRTRLTLKEGKELVEIIEKAPSRI